MDPARIFLQRAGGEAKIEVPLDLRVPKVRGCSATGAERRGIWRGGIPLPSRCFSLPSRLGVWRSVLSRVGVKIEDSQAPSRRVHG